MNLKQLIAFFSSALFLFSCAQIVPLSGGEKDIDAPKEVESSPKNGSINFSEKTITIEFDEFIKLNNVSSQLIVSPLMETPPEILVRGKKLVIKLEDELTPNTTYSLNFGNAITDITENNVFPNYKYVFSTGSYIDSLSYSGTVVNAFNLSKKDNIYVLLYDQFGDSIPYKEMPRYVALTDVEGNFFITNIANGNYQFFAIDDINGNYLFDLPNEKIAFKNEKIELDSSSSDNLIYLFEEEGGEQYVDKVVHKEYGKIDIVMNRPTENLRITPINIPHRDSWYVEEKNETGDTISMWLTLFNSVDQLKFSIADGETIIDTINIELIKELKDSTLKISTNLGSSFNLSSYNKIFISTHRPWIENIDYSEKVTLLKDSVEIEFHIPFIPLNERRKISILSPYIIENSVYQLYIPPGTFEDIYGLKNDTVKIDFKTKSESDYGIINLSIIPNFSENYIVQLFKNNKLIEETFVPLSEVEEKEEINTVYKYLLPGNYELKLMIDANGDKEWNTGNYLEGLQPERVIYYEKEIKIRANWDNDIVWTVNE